MFKTPATITIEDSNSRFEKRLNVNAKVRSLTIFCKNGHRPYLEILFDTYGTCHSFKNSLKELERDTHLFFSYFQLTPPTREPRMFIHHYYKFIHSILAAINSLDESLSTLGRKFLEEFPWEECEKPKVFENAHICELIAQDLQADSNDSDSLCQSLS